MKSLCTGLIRNLTSKIQNVTLLVAEQIKTWNHVREASKLVGHPTIQSPSQKENFLNGDQKLRKCRH